MNKKRIGKLLFLIVFLITLVIGFSYAFSNWNYIGSTFNKLTSSDLEISLLESETNVISLNNAFPMTDEEGLDTDSFDFAVTSKTVKEEGIRYTISIEKLEADTGYTFLNDSDVKIYLEDYEGNVLLEPTLISNLDNYKLYTGSHVHDSTNEQLQDKYKLKVWIDQSKENDAKSWDLDTKIQYKFKLNINNEETNNTFTVNAVANNGTITGNTSVGVVEGGNARFSIAPTDSTSEGIVSCTNNQTGTIKNNTLTVKNVNSNTTCTVTYTPSTTTLYTDGTLIINEKPSDRQFNITTHGAVTNEYQALSNQNAYVFNTNSSQPWNSQKSSITSVEIGQKIEPTNTKYWFYRHGYMTMGDFINLDTSNVTSMNSMFYQVGNNSAVKSLTLTGLNKWNTSKVTDMGEMFSFAGYNAPTWNIGDISNWDTSKVTSMSSMFNSAGLRATTWNIGNLSNWDTSKVTSMSSMFHYAGRSATTFDIGNLSNWDTSRVTDMSFMFSEAGYSATTFDIGNLSSWDTSSVTTMYQMFSEAGYSATTFELDLSNWDTSKVTSISCMFSEAGRNATTWSIGYLSNWDTSSVTGMFEVFYRAGFSATTFDIGDLSNWDTSQVTTMSSMFSAAGYSATTFDIGDLSNWDTSQVTTMSSMFSEAGRSATTFELDLSNWDTSKVTNMSSMFTQAGYSATTWSIGNLSIWDTSSVTSISGMFSAAGYSATTFGIGDLSSWDTSKVTSMDSMFFRTGYSATTFGIGDLSSWDTSKVTSMYQMFYQTGYNATTWNSIGTLKVYATGIKNMFYGCNKAKATLNILSVPTDYNNAFISAATASGAQISLNYNCTTAGVIDNLLAKKSASSNVVRGTNLEGTCPDRTIDVVVNNGTVNTSSTTVPNIGSATFILTPASGYSQPIVSCTNNQNGTLSGNTLTVSNVISDTTCTVTYYVAEAINLTDNDATYPWIETSGV